VTLEQIFCGRERWAVVKEREELEGSKSESEENPAVKTKNSIPVAEQAGGGPRTTNY